jgi:hypothetical protein
VQAPPHFRPVRIRHRLQAHWAAVFEGGGAPLYRYGCLLLLCIEVAEVLVTAPFLLARTDSGVPSSATCIHAVVA